MAIKVRQGGAWKDAAPRVRQGGVWKTPVSAWRKNGGAWVKVWPDALESGDFNQQSLFVSTSGGTGNRTAGAVWTVTGGTAPYTVAWDIGVGSSDFDFQPEIGSVVVPSGNQVGFSVNVFFSGLSQYDFTIIGSAEITVTDANGVQFNGSMNVIAGQ